MSRRFVLASTALSNAGIDLDRVRRALPSVDPGAVRFTPASRLARSMWAKGISAITMPWAVYVTPALYDRIAAGGDAGRYGELVVHELAHLHQYRTAGPVRHVVRYIRDYLRGRVRGLSHWEAYLGVTAEVEARDIAAGFGSSRGPR